MSDRVARFKAELPALANLIENCGAAAEKAGYLQAIDGRWGRIRKSGGRLLIHTVLNVLLQMTGSLAMKYSLCFAERRMYDEGVGLDDKGHPAFVANVHDEYQAEIITSEVKEMTYTVLGKGGWKLDEKAQYIDEDGQIWSAPSILEKRNDDEWIVTRKYHRAGHIMADTMREAGEFLRLRVPLAGEYKIGKSWEETH